MANLGEEVLKGQFKVWMGADFHQSIDQWKDRCKDERVEYSAFQMEQCPNTGNYHIQWLVKFEKKQRLSAVKKILNTVNKCLVVRKYNEARNYCLKEESRIDGPYEVGTWKPP